MNKSKPKINLFTNECEELLKIEYPEIYKAGMVVVDAVGLDGMAYSQLFFECLKATSSFGFFSVDPWHTRVKCIQRGLNDKSLKTSSNTRHFFGNFELTTENLKSLLDVWTSCGKWNSGDWYIAGYNGQAKKFLQLNAHDNVDLGSFLKHSEELGCLLCLEEMEQSMLLSRPFFNFHQMAKCLTE